MRKLAVVLGAWLLVGGALAQQPDLAVVKGTFTTEQRPASARTVALYCGIVQRALEQNGMEYDLLTEEQIVAGKLAGYKLAIFPFNTVWHDDEMQQVVKFIDGGGKLMWFYTVPPPLQQLLGIGKYSYRGVNYEGEFSVMQFGADRPPGFPAQVHQQSPNSRIVEEVAEGARALAVWHDKEGKDTGVPAVLLSDHGVWVSHVLWSAADAGEQRHLVLATLGHFIPGKWTEIVEGVMAGAAPAAGYDSLDALQAAVADNEVASGLAQAAVAQAEQARELLAASKFSAALGLAKQVQTSAQLAAAAAFASRPHELRGAWMGYPTDQTDWEQIMSELEEANFNAIFPLMYGPGSATYPSDYLPQVTETDQMKACIEAAHRHGIEVHVWKANWQVLHRAAAELRQQFTDDGRMVLSLEQAMGQEERSDYKWSTRWLDPSDERNRELEFNATMELVEKYHPDGIHFDFMRYPSRDYCYCSRCRQKFEKWAGVNVENWPEDCWEGGKYLASYRDWRRHLQTSLVKRIAERAREIDPNVKVSLAARASLTGSFEGDAQDWVTWAHEGYLDMLCPMDYTSSVEVLRNRLEPQIEAIDGAVPVYAGLGVSPSRSASPVNLSEQIKLARELGADGFLIFSLTSFSRAMLPALKLGATSTTVDLRPHHAQPAKATFTYPKGVTGGPERTYTSEVPLSVRVRIAAAGDAEQMILRALVIPAAGGEAQPAGEHVSNKRPAQTAKLELPPEPGVWQIVLQGEVVFKDGHREPFYLRSRPLRILTEQEKQALLERLQPPSFATDKLHVGVVLGGYGSEALLQALQTAEDLEPRPVYRLTSEALEPCQVLILPQLRDTRGAFTSQVVECLRSFVEAGGGLLVTHDAVGIRGHPAIFADVAGGLGGPVKEPSVIVAVQHPLTAGMSVGDEFTHSYYDHIPLTLGDKGTVVIKDTYGNAVVACGQVGRGRYVACGIAIGLGAGDADVRPTGAELTLLNNAVRWLQLATGP